MKFFHISDLHIGKRLHGFSLLEDQQFILNAIVQAIQSEKPDALLICGDVYDKSVPSGEAITVFDEFLCQAAALVPVLVIGGNHDCIERLSFGSRLMTRSRVYIAPAYTGQIQPITIPDEFGPVDFWLLPFLRPGSVRPFFPQETVSTYQEAFQLAISQLPLDPGRRNVLLSHQFVAGARLSDSEEFNVGGLDRVDPAAYQGFDYVALGHIHAPQNVSQTIRYCGTPLKYSLSESNQEKSITQITLGQKGTLDSVKLPLSPLRELRTLKGSFSQLTDYLFYSQQQTQDYLHIVLTDEDEIPEAMGRLRLIYPYAISLEYDNTRSRASETLQSAQQVASKSPTELFSELYSLQNNQEMTQEQTRFLEALITKVWRKGQ